MFNVKTIIGIALLALGCSTTLLAQNEVTYQANLIKKIYSMGTASVNGTYYPVGNAISRLCSNKLKSLVTIAEPTAGSMANVEYLRKKKINLALMQSDVAWMAYHGSFTYSGNAFKELRVMASLYSEKVQIVVRADSGIKTLSDLAGKKIAVGEKDSGSAAGAIQILEAAGLKQDAYELIYERFTNSTESLLDGYIDALYYVGGVPADGLSRLAAKTPIRLLEIPAEVSKALMEKFPYYSSEFIEAKSYNGQSDRVNSIGFKALLTCSEDTPTEEIISILSVIYSNPTIVNEQNETLVKLDREEALKGIDLEMLHKGASNFFSLR